MVQCHLLASPHKFSLCLCVLELNLERGDGFVTPYHSLPCRSTLGDLWSSYLPQVLGPTGQIG